MVTIPNKKEEKIPIIVICGSTCMALPLIISGSLNTILPKITGNDRRNENLDASILDNPKNLEVVSVAPDRLTPGKIAKL